MMIIIMTPEEATKNFISRLAVRERRNKFIGLLSGQKGRIKFLRALDHDLAKNIYLDKASAQFGCNEWGETGYFFSSSGSFGDPVATLKEAYDKAPWNGGWLIVSIDGNLAIFRPEGKKDNELYFQLK